MIRWGLAQLVSAEPDLELVGTAEDGVRAVELAELEHPDVVLLDLSMPELDGVAAAEQLRQRSPSTRVLVLSSHPQESVVSAAFLAGARGYLTKDVSTTDVLEGIRHVHAAEPSAPNACVRTAGKADRALCGPPLACGSSRTAQRRQ
jgi:DNA-binding NarL/FixJ family response regulator